MRTLCTKLETNGEKTAYEKKFEDIKGWYLEQHDKYEVLLKTDMLSELGKSEFGKEVLTQLQDWDSLVLKGYSDNSSAKSDLFDRTEQMCKLMLSIYSYGPDSSCPAKFNKNGVSWFDINLTFYHIIEILQAQLQAHNEGENLNLAVFTEEKTVRNSLTHQGEVSACTSVIRCYNTLRDMLIFMDSTYRSKLPRFTYPQQAACDMQSLMERLDDFNFGDESTMLVVGPLHDLPAQAKTILANLSWTIVFDLDGCSGFGGLRSAVQFPNVNDQKLEMTTAKQFKAKRGFTTWFTCGDFTNYAYCQPFDMTNQAKHLKKQGILFDAKTSFSDVYYGLGSDMQNCIEPVLEHLSSLLRPLNILYIHDYDTVSDLASSFIKMCENKFHRKVAVPYTFTSVYYDLQENWENNRHRLERSYSPDDTFPLKNLFCDLDSMASGLMEFQRDLPILSKKTDPYRLPSEGGITGIGQNLAVNLSDIFDVLYEDAGEVSQTQSDQERDEFYRGGTAAWSVFYNEHTVSLLPKEDYIKRLSSIEEVLAHIPDPDTGATKVYTILHSPGIGGSTLLRQIGWDLHRDYPVLLVKRYDPQIKGLIRNLYDDRKKGVLLLADENIGERGRLEEDIRTLDRACALIVSARKTSDVGSGKKRGIIHFNSISPAGERTLCGRFKKYSPLSDIPLQEKDRGYDAFVKPIGMRCPFMIGLYYQEEHFNGVTDYVERMMEEVKEKREVRILAMLAFCSCYGGIGLPQAFVNRYLQIPSGMSWFKNYPYAKTAFLPLQDGLCGNIDTYNPKHYLISWELLNQCSQRLYGSAAKNCLTDLSKLLIDAVFDAYQAKAADVYQDILEFIFIEKETKDDKFSQLILDAASPSSRKEILQYLAEKFNTLVEQNTPEDADYLYRMTAHFYGHLGRLCHNRDIGLDNPADAKTYCEKAVELMESSSTDHPDPLIYHMLGVSKSALLRKQLDATDLLFQESPGSFPTSEAYAAYENEIENIREIFEKTAHYGSEDYAISSLIKLYMQYLDKVYHWKNIHNTSQLSERQVGYRTEIERLLEWSYSKELNEKSRSEFQNLEDNYRSKFGQNGGDTILYYENRLSSLKGRAGVDEEILNARRGLITARLSRHFGTIKEKPGEYITLKDTELRSILEQLEEVLGGQCDTSNYRQRFTRINCYDRWFYLAKMPGSGRPLEKAISYSERWIDLSEQSGDNDPRPYYYYAICSTLYMLAGNSVDQSKIVYYWKKCESLGRNVTDKLRDVIVISSGMEQLLDMRYAGRNPIEYIEGAGKTPLILDGVFDRIEADRGYIRLYAPDEWNGKAVKFTRGKGNSVGGNQLSHKLQTFAGFSYEGFRAVDQYVRDITANEAPPQLSQRNSSGQKKSIAKNTEQNKAKRNPSPKSPIDPSTTKAANNAGDSIGSRKVFHPKYIKSKWDNPNEPQYLNGDVDDGVAGISVQYLTSIFGAETIDAFGGIRDILDTLIEKVHEIDTIVKDIRVSDEEKQYMLHLHDESIELLQLLQPQKMSEHSHETSEQAVQVKLLELPDFSGKKVTLIPSDLTLSKLTGAFQIDGEEYVGTLINVKTGNDKKKALKYKGKIPAIIQGKPQSGKYCLKML